MHVAAWLKRRRVRPPARETGLDEARRARQSAEQRLAHDHENVIVPLSEMRAANHIQEDIGRLIRRSRGEAEGT